MNELRTRWVGRNLTAAMRVLPVTVLTGARQTGKTTLARAIEPGRAYLTLDELGVLAQAEREPDALLAGRPVTLDEVQRAPSLLLAIKRAVDDRRRAGDFLLTGSSNLLLQHRVADTLAGRAIYLDLAPFCPTEWQQREDSLSPIERLFAPDSDWREWPTEPGNWQGWLLRGGFPSALSIAADDDRDLWFSAYVQTYLERDLRQLSAVSSLPDFQRLMVLAANRTGRLLNQADLARDAGLTHPTAHRYVNLLETGCLITRIRPLTTNPSVAIVKTPRLFWTDCGLAASLAGIRSAQAVQARPDSGFWLEQALFQTLQTWRAMNPQHRRVHFWRDRAGHEVDFVLEDDGQLVSIEVKSAGHVTAADLTGIRAFQAALKRGQRLIRSVVLHGGTESRQLDSNIFALPWGWMVPAW